MIILVFDSTHQALAAEKTALLAGIPNELLPTPREISANCGLGLKLSESHLSSVQALLSERGIRARIYRVPLVKGEAYGLISEEEVQ